MKRNGDQSPGEEVPAKKRIGSNAALGFDNRWRFKVEPPPPQFPFVNEFFEFSVFLVDGDGVLQTGHQVPIVLEFVVEGESTPLTETSKAESSGLIQIDPKTEALIGTSGCAKLRVKVCELSVKRNNRKFCFVVKRKPGPRPASLPCDIHGCMTRGMLVVSSQIVITNKLPEVWFKDQGRRDKGIDVEVELRNASGIVTGQIVPVKCTLLYEDLVKVLHQESLSHVPNSPLEIGESGRATLQVRIDDVSKNHGNKKFRIKVEPDAANNPLNLDKSSDVSSSVLVRSKLNKRQRETLTKRLLNAEDSDGANIDDDEESVTKSTKAKPETLNAAVLAAAGGMLKHTQKVMPMHASLSAAERTFQWCHEARCLLGQLQTVLGNIVQSYDQHIAAHVERSLNGALTTAVSQSAQVDGTDSAKGDGDLGDGVLSGLPDGLNRPDGIALERGISASWTDSFRELSMSMPVLARGLTSGLMGMGMFPDLNRGISSFSNFASERDEGPGPSALFPDNRGMSTFSLGGSGMSAKPEVRYVIHQVYAVNEQPKGLPAFSDAHKLLGFYFQKGLDVFFSPAELSLPENFGKHVEACERHLEELLQTRPAAVSTCDGSSKSGEAAAEAYFRLKAASSG